MMYQDIEHVLAALLPKVSAELDPPSAEDWNSLSKKFGCEFSNDFRQFIDLMSKYQFPGDIFNVSSGRTNGNDSISLAYDFEAQLPSWDPEMIPFFGIGNGDFFCLNRKMCPESPVYYYDHEADFFDEDAPTFEEWVKNLPEFLSEEEKPQPPDEYFLPGEGI